MKNAIIAVLALLCGFLGWKLYYNSPSQSLKELTEEKIFGRINNKSETYSDDDINTMINHFHSHTLKELKDKTVLGIPIGLDDSERTDRKVTKFISFDTTSLKNAIHSAKDGYVYFILAAFKKEQAMEYVNNWNDTHPKKEDKIKLKEVIQKPTVILSYKDSKSAIVTINVGKICPPPNGVCP